MDYILYVIFYFLTAGSFEIALLRMLSAYDPETKSVIFGTSFVPLDVFQNLSKCVC